MKTETAGRPGSYDKVLEWLSANSPATINQIGGALGLTRNRVLFVLRAAQQDGEVTSTLSDRSRWPLLWSVLPGDDDELVPDLEDSRDLLEQLHARTGWEYGITLTASTHAQWNAEVRVTPVPYARGASDRSYTALRVGPPEWALHRALSDVLDWLGEIIPDPAADPCFACGDEPGGYPGTQAGDPA